MKSKSISKCHAIGHGNDKIWFFLLLEDPVLIIIRVKTSPGLGHFCAMLVVVCPHQHCGLTMRLQFKLIITTMQGNLRACKVSPFRMKQSRSWALQEHLRCFDQPWVETAQSGHQLWAAWKSGPQHPLLLSCHSPCQQRRYLLIPHVRKMMLDEKLKVLWAVNGRSHRTNRSVYRKGETAVFAVVHCKGEKYLHH